MTRDVFSVGTKQVIARRSGLRCAVVRVSGQLEPGKRPVRGLIADTSRMGLLSKLLFLGNGRLPADLRGAIEVEGIVFLLEDLPGSIRYDKFRAPGKSFSGKVTGARIAFALSERRAVAYAHSGRAKLVNTPYDSPRWAAVDVVAAEDRLDLVVDYDCEPRLDPRTSGKVTIRMRTDRAVELAAELERRLGRR